MGAEHGKVQHSKETLNFNSFTGYYGAPGQVDCDKSFGDAPGANGCIQHNMTRFFGAQRYVTSWSTGRSGGGGFWNVMTFGLLSRTTQYSSFSSSNDTIYDQGMPLVYASAFTGYTITPSLFNWRPERTFLAAEAIIGEGPIGVKENFRVVRSKRPIPNTRLWTIGSVLFTSVTRWPGSVLRESSKPPKPTISSPGSSGFDNSILSTSLKSELLRMITLSRNW